VNVTEQPEMSHSLIGADRATHCRIVAVAAAATASLIILGAAAWRGESDTVAAPAWASAPVLKADKPAVSATVGTVLIR
jgi:hypothetical protein